MEELNRNDLLKYFIQYNNTNHESSMVMGDDVCCDDDPDGQKTKFMDQLKSLLNMLLHFRYMFMYVKRRCLPLQTNEDSQQQDEHDEDLMEFKMMVKNSINRNNNDNPNNPMATSQTKSMIDAQLEGFDEDLEFCLEQYNQLINSSCFFDFIKKREQFYQENMDSYYSFKRDFYGNGYINQNNNNILMMGGNGHNQNNQSNHHLNHHQMDNNTAMVDNGDIITVQPDLHPSLMGSPHSQTLAIKNKKQIPPRPPMTSSTATTTTIKPLTSTQQPIIPSISYAPVNDSDSFLMEDSKDYSTDLLQVEYWCSYLPCRFRSKSFMQVKAHEERRHVQQLLCCSFDGCSEMFQQQEDLDSHMSRVHLCTKMKCTYKDCHQIFTNENRLQAHIKREHKDDRDGNFACKECSKSFKTNKYLKKHINRMHGDKKKKKSKTKSKSKKSKKAKSKKPEKARILKKTFVIEDDDEDDDENKDNIKTDEQKEKEGQEDDDDKSLSPISSGPSDSSSSSSDSSSSDSEDSDDKKRKTNKKKKKPNVILECTLSGCNQSFTEKLKLNQHIRDNHTEEYLTCKFCDKICRSRNSLTNHIWVMHEEGDYRCTFENCDFKSRFRKNLLNHKKLRHQRERQCPICGENVIITRYQRHMSGLHKIKNHACSWPDCGKTFADHSSLKNHVRIHLNFKRFKCKWPACGYASEQRYTVITHIRVCHFKLPRTKKKQMELNINDDMKNPYDYLEVCREDICI